MASHDQSIDRDAHEREITALECVSGALAEAEDRLKGCIEEIDNAKRALDALAYRTRDEALRPHLEKRHSNFQDDRMRLAGLIAWIDGQCSELRSEMDAVYAGTGEVI